MCAFHKAPSSGFPGAPGWGNMPALHVNHEAGGCERGAGGLHWLWGDVGPSEAGSPPAGSQLLSAALPVPTVPPSTAILFRGRMQTSSIKAKEDCRRSGIQNGAIPTHRKGQIGKGTETFLLPNACHVNK